DHRVPALPSNAADAGVPVFSVDDAVAGFPCESRVVAAPAGSVVTATAVPAASARAAKAATVDRRSMMPPEAGWDRGALYRESSITLFNCQYKTCRNQPPAIAPITRKGSSPASTRSGSGVSGDSLDRSSSQA